MADQDRQLILEEAYVLALAGRAAEALSLIDRSGLDPQGTAERLCRARLALAAGQSDAGAELQALLSADGAGAWRAALELSRLERGRGRIVEAAALLQRSIDAFRRDGPPHEPTRACLAALLAAEVASLDGAGRPAEVPESAPNLGDAGAPDPRLLLRLVELGKRLADQTDPDQVLRVVLHEAIELTGTERGFIVLVAGEELEFALAENLDWTGVDRPAFEVSRTIIRGVLRDGRPLVLSLPEVEASHQPDRSLAEIGARSVACAPIQHTGTTLGVLYVDGHERSHAFPAQVERFLDLLAAQAGAALDNARTHQARARALEAAEESLRRHRSQSERRPGYGEIVGSSEAMQEVYRKLDLIAPTEMPVLILGETGTGKELAARLVHARGPRAAREFVATNCAGIAETLLESELFGHERGAFTGADRSRPGLFELADGGTLFLDEIGDMSLRMQADLLRALQSGEVRRVGGRQAFHVDVRVIAATHRDLEELQRRGEFREDLFYRLNVLVLQLPALRERAEDIPQLVGELLARIGSGEGAPPPRVSERALARLAAYAWPGNVRELQNVLRRISVLGLEVVDEQHLPQEILRSAPRPEAAGSLRRAEADAVRRALASARGNKAEAARILGVDRKTLYAKLRRIADGPGTTSG
jgi:Nif-specific regulatory protein